MSVKIALLKSGETIISDVKELVTGESEEDQKRVYGYLFINPKKVSMASPVFLAEESKVEESSVQVSHTSWSLITKDTEFVLPKDWIVTFMEPVDKLVGMYEESLND